MVATRTTLGALVLVAAGAACDLSFAQPSAPPAGKPRGTTAASVETRAPEAPAQKPARAGQTRAPKQVSGVTFEVTTVASGLDHPWGMAFLPDGQMLVTEKPGRMRVVGTDGALSKPVAGLPRVDARDQGGLLDVALDPDYASNRLVYWSYAEPRKGGNGTAVARGKLALGAAPRVSGVKVIWRMTPTMDSTKHFGSRLVFGTDKTLFITTGERSILPGRKQAQDLASAFGKVIRVNRDGTIPKDNPFVGKKGALAAIWSYGHRNIQSAALHPKTGVLWTVEHGARGGDELNIPQAGKNYGWPVITYGIEYSGGPIGDGITQKDGMEQPVYYWDPVIAPSGMAFYTADLFPAWKGSLFVGGLKPPHLARLALEGDKVVGEERLLAERGKRVRDVRAGPDGAVYVLTDEADGELWRLAPAKAAVKPRS